jgi:hypothetical protein
MPEIKPVETQLFYYENYFKCVKDFPDDKKRCHSSLMLEMSIVDKVMSQNLAKLNK